MTKLDLTKPVQTRDGYPVRILCTDRKSNRPLVGLVTEDSCEVVCSWPTSGRFYSDEYHPLDLINVPPKPVKYYTHVYGHPDTRPGDHLTHTTTCKEPPPSANFQRQRTNNA